MLTAGYLKGWEDLLDQWDKHFQKTFKENESLTVADLANGLNEMLLFLHIKNTQLQEMKAKFQKQQQEVVESFQEEEVVEPTVVRFTSSGIKLELVIDNTKEAI